MSKKQRFRDIFGREIESVCEERTAIPGYRKALTDTLYEIIDKEKMRLEYDQGSGGIQQEIKDALYRLGDFIGKE